MTKSIMNKLKEQFGDRDVDTEKKIEDAFANLHYCCQ